jgi:hypothetical protein
MFIVNEHSCISFLLIEDYADLQVALDWLHDKTNPAISGIALVPFPSKTILDNHKGLFNNLSGLVVVLYALHLHGRIQTKKSYC